jgi:PAS domain S-box-containing protein
MIKAIRVLQQILASTPESVTVQERDGALSFANESAAKLLGFPSPEALCDAPLASVLARFDVLDARGAPLPLEELPSRIALSELRPAEQLVRFRVRATGEERWSWVSATPVFEGGQLVRVVNVFRDVTEQKRSEMNLRFLADASFIFAESMDEETTLAALARAAVPAVADWCSVELLEPGSKAPRQVAVAHVDPDKVRWARRLRQRFPPNLDDPRGLPNVLRTGVSEYMTEIPKDVLEAAAVDDERRRILDELGLRSYMVVPLKARGRILGAITFVSAESGRRYRMADLVLAEDLASRASLAVDNVRLLREQAAQAEQGRAEKALAQQARELARSNAELQQFAYVASHDLKEPLRMVSSYTQLLARRYKGKLGADADEFIGFAVDGVARMQTLIDDLLSYSRLSQGPTDLRPVRCDDALDRALGDLRAALEASSAVVTRGELPELPADSGQLAQLFQNLVGNAVKFRGPEPPRVHVSAEPKGDAWELSVRDNGIGIAPEYHDRVFVIFQRLHTRTEYPGNGIGLSICKKIVERHGGRIWIESTPGQGSIFRFTLPAERGHLERTTG